MTYYQCYECNEIFTKEEAGSRASELEDGMRPWDSVMLCPACGSEELRELDNCLLCGGPVTDNSQFCVECREEIDEAFEHAFRRMNSYGKDSIDLKRLMFERAEETGFYGTN